MFFNKKDLLVKFKAKYLKLVSREEKRSKKQNKREWHYAWTISISLHVLMLMAWLWSYERLAEPVNLVVELKSVKSTPSRAAATVQNQQSKQSTRVKTQKTIQKAAKTSAVEPSHEVKRELNLVRPTRTQQTKPLPRSADTKELSSLLNNVEKKRELTLTRSSRYVASRGAGSTAQSKTGSAKEPVEQKKNTLPQQTRGQSVGVTRASTSVGKKPSATASSSSSHIARQSATRSSFNWKDGRQERVLLSKQQSSLPERFRNKGIHAQAIVVFQVDKSGRTHSIELVKSSGYHELDDWTTRYVRTFRFNRVQDKLVYQAEYIQWFKP